MQKPRIFIGSSSELLDQNLPNRIKNHINSATGNKYDIVIWNECFDLNDITINKIIIEAEKADFAIFIWGAEDKIEKKGKKGFTSRDNVILETGIFIGKLTRENVFMLFKNFDLNHLPSDLKGVTVGTFKEEDINDYSGQDAITKFLNNILIKLKNVELKSLEVGKKNIASIRTLEKNLRKHINSNEAHKLKFLGWRLEKEFDGYFNKIDSGQLRLTAYPRFAYLQYVLGNILGNLEEGDEYKTLSNSRIWSEGRFLEPEFFIEKNIIAANNGAKVDRIVIINKNIIEAEILENVKDKTSLKELYNLVGKFSINMKNLSDTGKENFKTRFYLSKDYERESRENFGSIKIGNNFMTVIPDLDSDRNPPFFTIKFQNESLNKDYLAKFERKSKDTKNIKTLEQMKELLFSLELKKLDCWNFSDTDDVKKNDIISKLRANLFGKSPKPKKTS